MLLLLLAQTEPISGGAGWVGAGLLGLVLCWVFFVDKPAQAKQMDKKDEQIMKLIESRDQLAKDMSAENAKAIASISNNHRESVKEITSSEREAVKTTIDASERRHQENLEAQRLERAERQQQFATLMAEHQKTSADDKEVRHRIANLHGTMKNWLLVAIHALKIQGVELPMREDEDDDDKPLSAQRPGR